MEIPEIIALLERATGQKARPYSTFEFGRAKDSSCVSVVVREDRAKTLLYDIRKQLLIGFLAFIGTTRWLYERHKGVEIAVGKGSSQFDILRLAKSDAVNFDMDTEDIVRKLQAWDESCGVDVFHAETDTIELSLMELPVDMQAFANDVYEFCPDIVDQGVGSVEALERLIRDSRQVHLWWD
jgi:hypothetical protein